MKIERKLTANKIVGTIDKWQLFFFLSVLLNAHNSVTLYYLFAIDTMYLRWMKSEITHAANFQQHIINHDNLFSSTWPREQTL